MRPSGGRRRSLEGGRTRASPMKSAFDVLDADNDGKISKEDLRSFYAYAEATNSVQEDDEVIGTMMRVADLNKDGFVEYEEFQHVLVPEGRNRNRKKKKMMIIMEEAFQVMDKDGDGILSVQDLKDYMGWAGFQVSDDDILSMIRLAASGKQQDDVVGNHGVTFDDLVRILAL